MNTQEQLAAQQKANMLKVKEVLSIGDAVWKGRTSEQVLHLGKFTVLERGVLLWTGTCAVTRDGIYYKVRAPGGSKFDEVTDKALRVQSGMWWSSKANLYFGKVWDGNVVEFLKKAGVSNVKLIPEMEASRDIPEGVKLVTVPAPVSTNMHVNGSVGVVTSDLPTGVVLNASGRPSWAKGTPNEGRFVSKEVLAQLRQAQGITVTPAQQVSAPKETPVLASVTPVATVTSTGMSEYELGRYVASWDDARGLGEVEWESESDEWQNGYNEYFHPTPKVDEDALMNKLESKLNDGMAMAITGILAALKAEIKDALGK